MNYIAKARCPRCVSRSLVWDSDPQAGVDSFIKCLTCGYYGGVTVRHPRPGPEANTPTGEAAAPAGEADASMPVSEAGVSMPVSEATVPVSEASTPLSDPLPKSTIPILKFS